MIRIITPEDPTTRCIERQARRLDRRLDTASRIYVVKPNDASKNKCHEYIRQWPADDLIVFMGHGWSEGLYGSRGKHFDMAGNEDAKDRDSDEFYDDNSFVDDSSYGLFAGKEVVCFACESNLLGKKLVSAGAKKVVGFGKMPSSKKEFDQDLPHIFPVKPSMIAFMNGVLNVTFREAVLNAVRMGGGADDIAIYFKMEMRKQVSRLLQSKAKWRYDLANVLYDVAASVETIRRY